MKFLGLVLIVVALLAPDLGLAFVAGGLGVLVFAISLAISRSGAGVTAPPQVQHRRPDVRPSPPLPQPPKSDMDEVALQKHIYEVHKQQRDMLEEIDHYSGLVRIAEIFPYGHNAQRPHKKRLRLAEELNALNDTIPPRYRKYRVNIIDNS